MTEKQIRIVLVLGKFTVVDITHPPFGQRQLKIRLGGTTTMTCNLPDIADVRRGDILTFYTEVLTKEHPLADA